jgi:hypothetical protein
LLIDFPAAPSMIFLAVARLSYRHSTHLPALDGSFPCFHCTGFVPASASLPFDCAEQTCVNAACEWQDRKSLVELRSTVAAGAVSCGKAQFSFCPEHSGRLRNPAHHRRKTCGLETALVQCLRHVEVFIGRCDVLLQ